MAQTTQTQIEIQADWTKITLGNTEHCTTFENLAGVSSTYGRKSGSLIDCKV